MNRIFVNTFEFDKLWKDLGNSDEELRAFQNALLNNPKLGKVIEGTNGLRKLRWQYGGKGKRGGIGILYLDIEEYSVIYFIALIKKNEKENLSENDKQFIKKVSNFN